jgi:hypothetical protein
VSVSLHDNQLTETAIDTTINYVVTRVDRTAAKLAGLVALLEECKTPGPRH